MNIQERILKQVGSDPTPERILQIEGYYKAFFSREDFFALLRRNGHRIPEAVNRYDMKIPVRKWKK